MNISEYVTFEQAYQFLNEKLFESKLPVVFFTYQRKPHSLGYCHFERFSERDGSGKMTELAMNPEGFHGRDDKEILSTLLHEMVHIWQCYFDEPPRKGYHDKPWAFKMEELGLMPSNTGEPGGKKLGQKMSHYIIEGGKFDLVIGAFLLKHKLVWEYVPEEKVEKEKKKTRVKYTCPVCGTNIWAKAKISVICEEDKVLFVAEDADMTGLEGVEEPEKEDEPEADLH
jgi:predicted SprT family Zn-dependent metalloprotease